MVEVKPQPAESLFYLNILIKQKPSFRWFGREKSVQK